MDGDAKAAAIRAYKETPRPAGVFCVRNTDSGRVMLGTSVDLPSMLNRQRFQLEMGGHASKELQADWNRAGAEVFQIEVLDTLEERDDPGADLKEELEELLAMWEERVPGERYRR